MGIVRLERGSHGDLVIFKPDQDSKWHRLAVYRFQDADHVITYAVGGTAMRFRHGRDELPAEGPQLFGPDIGVALPTEIMRPAISYRKAQYGRRLVPQRPREFIVPPICCPSSPRLVLAGTGSSILDLLLRHPLETHYR